MIPLPSNLQTRKFLLSETYLQIIRYSVIFLHAIIKLLVKEMATELKSILLLC